MSMEINPVENCPIEVGTVEILRRYPVKSMMGETLERAFVAYSGLMGDRVFAFVNPEKRGNFPWHTVREYTGMLLYKPRFRGQLDPAAHYPNHDEFAVDVTTPDGRQFSLHDKKFLAELREESGCDFELRFSEKGMPDSHPVSIFGLDTLRALGEEVGVKIDHRRFRANFYVRWIDSTPFYEDELVGKCLKVGETLEIMIVKKDTRCKIVTVDPDTADVNPDVLRTIARKHAGCAGVYAVVLREGVVEPGAKVQLLTTHKH